MKLIIPIGITSFSIMGYLIIRKYARNNNKDYFLYTPVKGDYLSYVTFKMNDTVIKENYYRTNIGSLFFTKDTEIKVDDKDIEKIRLDYHMPNSFIKIDNDDTKFTNKPSLFVQENIIIDYRYNSPCRPLDVYFYGKRFENYFRVDKISFKKEFSLKDYLF